MQKTNPSYPASAFCFKVMISKDAVPEDVGEAYFRSVSGLRSEHEVLDVREGGVNGYTHRLIGAVKWSNLILKRGFTGSPEFIAWRNKWVMGTEMKRAEITIVQLASDMHTVIATWKAQKAWPVKWEVSEFDATKSELTMETLEIAHHGLVMT
jgi:phage tail-like protein